MNVQEVLTSGEVLGLGEELDRGYVMQTTVQLGAQKVAVVYKAEWKHRNRSITPADYNWHDWEQTNPYLEDFAQYLAKLTGLARVPVGVLRRVPGITSPVWVQEFIKGTIGWGVEEYSSLLAKQHHDLLLFDIIIANNDRHGGNWFKLRDDTLIAIDHGIAFREVNNSIVSFVGATAAMHVGKYLGLQKGNSDVYDRVDRLPITEGQRSKLAAFLTREAEVRTYGHSIGAPVETLDGMFRRATLLHEKCFIPARYATEAEFLA